jgi:hypothetical protein
MRRSAVAVSAVVATAMVFVACSERDTTTPRLPGAANFSATLTPATTCDFTQINKAANNYFTSKQDPVYTLIGNMKSAGGGTAAATTIGWQILRQVAAERLSSATGAGSDGAIFVNDVLRCTTYAFGAGADVDVGFTNNLALILDQGLFGVRGGAADDPTRPAAAMVAGRNAAPPGWGVQPDPTGSGTWPTDRGTFLAYGYPTVTAGLPITTATAINGTYNGFELGAVPFGISKAGMLVGICSSSVGGNTANRLTHVGSGGDEILVNVNPAALCSFTAGSPPLLGTQSWSKGAVQRLASLVLPKTAYAMMDSSSEIGGLPSSWSPFNTAALLGSSIVLTYNPEPNDALDAPTGTEPNSNIHFVVTATVNGIVVPGVTINVSIFNNMGSPAGAIITSGATQLVTKKDGTATFDITVGKPGGYFIAGVGSIGAATSPTQLSTQFHIKNQ